MRVWTLGLLVVSFAVGCGASSSAGAPASSARNEQLHPDLSRTRDAAPLAEVPISSNVALSSATIVDARLPDSRMSSRHTEPFEGAGPGDTELPESRGSLSQNDVALPASRGSLAEHAIPMPESRGSLGDEPTVPALETWRVGAPR